MAMVVLGSTVCSKCGADGPHTLRAYWDDQPICPACARTLARGFDLTRSWPTRHVWDPPVPGPASPPLVGGEGTPRSGNPLRPPAEPGPQLWLPTPERMAEETWANPARNPWQPLAGDALIEGLTAYLDAVGLPFWNSPPVTSDRLINRRWIHKVRAGQEPGWTEKTNVEIGFDWSRRATSKELTYRWAHKFDGNAAYLAAASRMSLPCGPVRQLRIIAFQRSRAGYWLIQPPPADPDLPDPFAPHGLRGRDPVWMTTPTARYAIEEAGADGPLDAWVWDDAHYYLDDWYETLKAARAALLPHRERPADDPKRCAYNAVKMTYTHGVGRMGSDNRNQSRDDPLWHPYWRWALIAESRTRLVRKLGQLGQAPVAVYADDCYWLTNTKDPARFADQLGIKTGDGIGQFTHKGTIPGAAVAQALEQSTNSRSAWQAIWAAEKASVGEIMTKQSEAG